MEKWTVAVALIMLVVHSSAYDTYWLSIDCGAISTSKDEITGLTWQTDEEFIKIGENNFLPRNNIRLEMKTLRIFPNNNSKNCYNLTLETHSKYILRAGFYYGNYDNLLMPPTFLLKVSAGNYFNVTVTTSLRDDPIYHEIIFMTKTGAVDASIIYILPHMTFSFDLDGVDRFDLYGDLYKRIWKPQEVPNYRSLYASYETDGWSRSENHPPIMVLLSAVEAHNINGSNSSIFISVNFHENSQLSAYFVFYFATVPAYPLPNGTRKVAIYFYGQQTNVTQVPDMYEVYCAVVSIYPVSVTGTANVTISPAKGTMLPPLLNSMEVFSVIRTYESMAVRFVPFFGVSLVFFLSFLGILSLSV